MWSCDEEPSWILSGENQLVTFAADNCEGVIEEEEPVDIVDPVSDVYINEIDETEGLMD